MLLPNNIEIVHDLANSSVRARTKTKTHRQKRTWISNMFLLIHYNLQTLGITENWSHAYHSTNSINIIIILISAVTLSRTSMGIFEFECRFDLANFAEYTYNDCYYSCFSLFSDLSIFLVGCFMTCLGRVAYYLLIMPWAIFTIIISILDVVAVGFFFYDLFNTLVCMNIS